MSRGSARLFAPRLLNLRDELPMKKGYDVRRFADKDLTPTIGRQR